MENLNINNEIGKLKKIMLHRPGFELDRICPDDLEEVLFDDIPWMERMRKEHDGFRDLLESNGASVVYTKDYLKDVLLNMEAKKEIVEDILEVEVCYDKSVIDTLREYLLGLNPSTLAKVIISGLSIREWEDKKESLFKYMPHGYGYYFKPLPNLYFMRDVSVVINNGIAFSKMKNPIRSRESLILRLIHKYHKDFTGSPVYYDNKAMKMSLEGGDVLILSEEVVAVGFSQRSSIEGIEALARNLILGSSKIKKVLAIKIPHVRAFMHLDTVFTMVDKDKFVIFPNILKDISVTEISSKNGKSLFFENQPDLKTALSKALNLRGVNLILSGGDDPVISAREQWNDSTNTLAIAPGVVVTYNRNQISNEILDKNDIKVLTIEGSELVRGRGGPRCMSMPLVRENL